MKRWANCPGSVALCSALPPQASTVYAEEGTKAHALAEAILTGQTVLPEHTPEMRESVDVYVRHCRDVISGLGLHGHWAFERRFDLSELHPGLFGTCDFVAYSHEHRTLYVSDYKHGAGIGVDILENEQLLYYALGAELSYRVWNDVTKPKLMVFAPTRVVLTIVQPRCEHSGGPVRTWETTPDRLFEFAGELIEAARRTEQAGAPLSDGAWCRFCPAAGVCPKLAEKSLELAQSGFPQVREAVGLPAALAMIPKLETWISAVKEFAYKEALAGRVPAGHKLVEKRATRKWVDEMEAAQSLIESGVPADLIFEPQRLKSPTQIEELIKPKSEAKRLTAPLVKSVSSGTKLVPESDPAPAVLDGAGHASSFPSLE